VKGVVLHVLNNTLDHVEKMWKVVAMFHQIFAITFGGSLTTTKIKGKQE
jgi:benzoyl-CoA reductase/2-hydroxyglutaryl-CoA dehydratase subunit BcrC/BadD/HgdB